MLDLRQLKVFITIAEEMSFTKAAGRLNVAQPALTMQIKRLEQQIGFELFERAGRSIKLSPSGHIFLETAREILALTQRGIRRAGQAAVGRAGKLKIGYIAATEYRVLKRIMPDFIALYPDISLDLQLVFGIQQIEMVIQGDIDVALTWLPPAHVELNRYPLATETAFICVPKDHPLAKRSAVEIGDLHAERLILFHKKLDPVFYKRVEDLFSEHNAVMNVQHEVDHPASSINFVTMGFGAAIVPTHVMLSAAPTDDIVFRPLNGLSRDFGMMWRAETNPVVKTFTDHVISHMAGAAADQ